MSATQKAGNHKNYAITARIFHGNGRERAALACRGGRQRADDAVSAGAARRNERILQQILVAADDLKRDAREVVAGLCVAYDDGEGGGHVDVSGLIEYGADGRLESGRCTGARGLGEEEEKGDEDDVAAGAGARGRVPLLHQETG